MFDDPLGPIEHFSWGNFIICGNGHGDSEAGRTGVGKDIRLIGRDVREWSERHGHNLTPDMISGVYSQGIEVLVIGSGVYGLVKCPDEVRRAIEAEGIGRLILEPTPDACRTYNALYHEGRRVAMLAHGTC